MVPAYTWAGISNVRWQNEQAKELTGLSYDVLLSTEAGLGVIHIQIEAEGYLPEISRGLKAEEEDAVVHFALHRGSGVAGIVRLTGSAPLAGAEVLLSTPARPVQLNNGRPQAGLSDQWLVKTRADGRFTLPPSHPPFTILVVPSPGRPQAGLNDQRVVKTRADGRFTLPPGEPPYTIVVVHDRGHAELTVKARPAVPPQLTIEPWGRVEGTLRIGRQPAPGQKLCLAHESRRDPAGVVYRSGFATTGAEGRFEFNRVVPGEVRISRLIEWKDRDIGSPGGSPSAVVHVAPAATVRLTLGGTGRPVVGKAALPAGFAARANWLFGFCYLIRRPLATGPPAPSGAGSLRAADTNFTFKVEHDGSFRIEDVEAGSYDLVIEVNKRPRDSGGLGHEVLATCRREVVVPVMPEGRSDEPLQLGESRYGPEQAGNHTGSTPALSSPAGRAGPSRSDARSPGRRDSAGPGADPGPGQRVVHR